MIENLLNNVLLELEYAGSLTVISAETGIDEPISNPVAVLFRIKVIRKGTNPSLLPPAMG